MQILIWFLVSFQVVPIKVPCSWQNKSKIWGVSKKAKMYVVGASICKWHSMCGIQNSFVDTAVKTFSIKQLWRCGWRGGKKYGLIFMNMPTQLDCDQEKQRRLETVKKNSLEISLQVCYWYWYSNCRESKHADTRTLLRNRARIWPKNVKKGKEEANSQRSIRGVYLCVTACMKRRRDRQKEKNAISVRFLQTEDLGHLKEYGWISNTAATAELNLLNSPAGGDRVRKRGKEEMSEGERTQNGKRRRAGEGMGETCGVGGMKQKERLREGREEIKQ